MKMKVKDLIKHLEKFDKEKKVVISYDSMKEGLCIYENEKEIVLTSDYSLNGKLPLIIDKDTWDNIKWMHEDE